MARPRKKFIKDDIRAAYMNAIYNRIRNGKSVLLTGKFGSGKSLLLEHIRPKKRRIVWVESLAPLHHMLASILKQLDFDVNMRVASASMEHLAMICATKNAVIIIDEANDMKRTNWPYIKRIMNAGIPVVLAGLPKVRVFLEMEHEDILSRLKVLQLTPLRLDEIKANTDMFEPDALDILYGAAGDNMRVFDELCDDCLDKIEELNLPKVTVDIAALFVG